MTIGQASAAGGVRERIALKAHAKLNLTLSVAPPEPPGSPKAGWHRIASWFHALELHDDVEIARLPRDNASTTLIAWAPDAPRPSPIDWPIEKDLAHRARALLEQHVGRALPSTITIRKRIPAGGGLGGGSSDAAAALMGLNALFGLCLSPAALRQLSASLGSDIAYFIDDGHEPPRPAIVEGFGDVIERQRPLGGEVELIFPPFGCETRAVYRAFDQSLPAGHTLRAGDVRRIARQAGDAGRVDSAALFNDLLAPADAVSMGRILPSLRSMGDAHMSGSGSTLFRIGASPGNPPAGCATVRTKLV